MKIFIKLHISLLFLFVPLMAQIKFFTTSTTRVGPGVIHKKIIAPQKPWMLNVLEIDLTNPYIKLESVKANNKLASRATTTAMVIQNDYEGHQVVGAINGDFYDGQGIPIGAQVVNGELLKGPISRSTIGFNHQNLPMTEVVSLAGQLIVSEGILAINDINTNRGTDQLILYNRFFGGSTGTNEWGTEVLIKPLQEWMVNDTMLVLVDSIEYATGNMSISPGKAVLSGNGSADLFLSNHIQKGDSIKLFLSLIPGLKRLKELIGGFPKIVKNGQNYAQAGYFEEGGSSTFHTDIHPRTAAGFSSDSTKLYLITVDGRQSISLGMNLIELAEFMIHQGVHNGINLDGGGSTTIVVRGNIENSPSDGSEREVSNALMTVSSAPIDSLNTIQIIPDYCRILIGKSIGFQVSGWDAYFNPKSINAADVRYTVDARIGAITSNGNFTATTKVDSGYVYAQYDSFVDSAFVYIKTVQKIEISPKLAVTDTTESIRFKVIATDEDYLPAPFSNIEYQWQCLNPEIGYVDSAGTFKAVKEGTAKIVASIAGVSDTAEAKVEIIKGSAVLDSMDTLQGWILSGVLIDSAATNLDIVDAPKSLGKGAFRLDYQFIRSATGRSYLNLQTDTPVFGRPDTIALDIKSDGQKHWVNLYVSDENGEIFRGSTGKFAEQAEQYDTLTVSTKELYAVNSPASFHFPISIRTIEIRLGYYTSVGDTNRGTIYLDNLRAIYPDMVSTIPIHKECIPNKMRLFQNYPNPFNSGTTIEFETSENGPVALTIYDVTGKKVVDLLKGSIARGSHKVHWQVRSLASGIYLYRLKTRSGETRVKKMILLK